MRLSEIGVGIVVRGKVVRNLISEALVGRSELLGIVAGVLLEIVS